MRTVQLLNGERHVVCTGAVVRNEDGSLPEYVVWENQAFQLETVAKVGDPIRYQVVNAAVLQSNGQGD